MGTRGGREDVGLDVVVVEDAVVAVVVAVAVGCGWTGVETVPKVEANIP